MKDTLYDFLSEYNQEHLTINYDNLNNNEKENLLNDIGSINFNFINKLYKDSFIKETCNVGQISPLKIIDKDTLDNKEVVRSLGKEAIKNGEYSIVLLAGDNNIIDDGCLEFDIHGKKVSIYELYINELKLAKRKFKKYIELYIMTNKWNNEKIIKYLKSNNYFGYPKQCIHYFTQSELPVLDLNGKVVLENDYTILKESNGNGDVFESLKDNNIINELKDKGIKYLLFISINNVFHKITDIKFLGSLIKGDYPVGIKGNIKLSKNDSSSIYAKYLNKPTLIDGNNIDNDMFYLTNTNNKYTYRYMDMSNYIIKLSEVEKYSNIDLKYNMIEEDNKYKFKKFITSAFEYSSDSFIYEAEEDEYYPIECEENIKTVEKRLNKKIAFEKEEELVISRFMKKEKALFDEYLDKDMNILDFACGKGNISLNLYRLGYKHITGHDLYKANIRLLKKYVNESNLNLVFNQSVLEKLKYEDQSFDAVIYSMNEINLDALNEFHRVLKNRGLGIIITPERVKGFLKPDIYKIIDIVDIGNHMTGWVVEKLPIENIIYL